MAEELEAAQVCTLSDNMMSKNVVNAENMNTDTIDGAHATNAKCLPIAETDAEPKTKRTVVNRRKRGKTNPLPDLHIPEKFKKTNSGETVASAFVSNELMSKIEATLQSSLATIKLDISQTMKKDFQEMMAEAVQTQLGPFHATIQNKLEEVEKKIGKLETDNQLIVGLKKQVQKIDSVTQSHKGEIKKLSLDIKRLQDSTDKLETLTSTVSLEAVSQRLSDLEQSNSEQGNTVFHERLGTLEKQIKQIEGKPTLKPGPETEVTGVVIKNLPQLQDEDDNPEVTLNLVKKLIAEGLTLTSANVVSAERKPKGSRPAGLIIAKFDDPETRSLVLKGKSQLRNHEQYRQVYIEPFLPLGVRQQHRNTRLLLNAVGKHHEFTYRRGSLVRRRPSSSSGDK